MANYNPTPHLPYLLQPKWHQRQKLCFAKHTNINKVTKEQEKSLRYSLLPKSEEHLVDRPSLFANSPMVLVILVKVNFCCGGRRGPEQGPLGLWREKGPRTSPLFKPLFKTQSTIKVSTTKNTFTETKLLSLQTLQTHEQRQVFCLCTETRNSSRRQLVCVSVDSRNFWEATRPTR